MRSNHESKRTDEVGVSASGGAGLDHEALDDETLLRLWRVARRMAYARCRRTLARLHAGQGGFYDVDDFEQDLFLEFWALLRRRPDLWRSGCQDVPHATLWTAWQRLLWGGGIRVLRHAPQRLWEGGEWTVDPARLSLDDDEEGTPMTPLAQAVARELVDDEDAVRIGERLDRLEQLERALWSLRPSQRQAIYMGALADVTGVEAGRRLFLPSANTFYQRLFAARAILRRRVS